MIFDDIAGVMNQDTVRRMSKRLGLSKDKVYRMSNGEPFVLDYDTVFALQKMGYAIKLEKLPPIKK